MNLEGTDFMYRLDGSIISKCLIISKNGINQNFDWLTTQCVKANPTSVLVAQFIAIGRDLNNEIWEMEYGNTPLNQRPVLGICQQVTIWVQNQSEWDLIVQRLREYSQTFGVGISVYAASREIVDDYKLNILDS